MFPINLLLNVTNWMLFNKIFYHTIIINLFPRLLNTSKLKHLLTVYYVFKVFLKFVVQIKGHKNVLHVLYIRVSK